MDRYLYAGSMAVLDLYSTAVAIQTAAVCLPGTEYTRMYV